MAFGADLAGELTAFLHAAGFLCLGGFRRDRHDGEGENQPDRMHSHLLHVTPGLRSVPLCSQGRQWVGATWTAELVAALIQPLKVRRQGKNSACTSFRSITLSSRSVSKGALAIGSQLLTPPPLACQGRNEGGEVGRLGAGQRH